jgi:Fe-S oxidoreductase/nitrate reductase gamma subunit
VDIGFISSNYLENEEHGATKPLLMAFDILFIGLALLIMFVGIARRWSAWHMGQEEDRAGDLAGLVRYILGHKKILKNRKSGITHLIVFWGFVVPLLIVILAQVDFTIPRIPAQVLSLLTDILGIFLLAGTLFFLARRIRSTDQRGPQKAIFPLCIMLLILITGFLAEGTRLSIVHPQYTWESPFGWLLSICLPPSPILMQLTIRIHFFAVLFFITALPFTFIRHLAAAPLNVFYRRKNPLGALKPISLEKGVIGANTVKDFSWKQLLDAEACVSCGRCEENCPAFISGKPLSPRKVIQDILEQMESVARSGIKTVHSSIPPLESRITPDEIWSCTTCMACVEHCPVFIEPMDKIIDMRRYQIMGKGLLPAEAGAMIRNLEIYGDVHGKGIAHRKDWTLTLGVPSIGTEGLNLEILLWVGCSGTFHPRYQEVSRAMVCILKAAGVRFGILGKDELCCGDPARRLGEESLFLELARKNIHRLKKYHVKKIVTLCPHCFNTLKNEYPHVEGDLHSGGKANIEVVHATEYVMNLIEEKRVSPKYPIGKRVAIHDPCYLGRVNHVYEPPREIIKSLPETQLKELKRHHENGFCCGGGGGRMWLHEHLGRRINVIRAEEVSETEVDILGTACPYCLTMLDDGIKALEMEKPPKVLDIVEMVASSIA